MTVPQSLTRCAIWPRSTAKTAQINNVILAAVSIESLFYYGGKPCYGGVLINITIDNTRTPVFYSTQRQRDIVMTNLNNIPDLMNDKLVDMVFITEFTGLSNKWFYKLIQEGEFPKPIKLGRSSRWLQSEIETWMQQRIVDSRG